MKTTADSIHACGESRLSDTPTPLEYAFELLGVNHQDSQRELVAMVDLDRAQTYFGQGWDAGVECDLSEGGMPVKTTEPKEARAWLVGFIAGQYAQKNNYPTPFCIFTEHEH